MPAATASPVTAPLATAPPATAPPATAPPATAPRAALTAAAGPVPPARSSGPRRGGRAADAGMATAEYAIATLAACGFAGLLVTILRSGEVRGLLLGVIRDALSVG